MGVFDHAEYDGDIYILIGGFCNQQIQDDCLLPLDSTEMCAIADNIM